VVLIGVGGVGRAIAQRHRAGCKALARQKSDDGALVEGFVRRQK
jgi:hypothetical protein